MEPQSSYEIGASVIPPGVNRECIIIDKEVVHRLGHTTEYLVVRDSAGIIHKVRVDATQEGRP